MERHFNLFQFMINTTININIREFLRDHKKFIGRNKTVIIEKYGKPQAVIVPYKEWNKKNTQKRITLKDIEKYSFNGGDKNLSENIDKILYIDPYK